MNKLLLVFSAALAISGCGEKIYDAAYYQANHEKAEGIVKKCQSGEESGQNCTNAREGLDKYKAQAFENYMLGKTKELPK
ncbi:EexN family lipoprotein [Rahnella sp. ChDrAdgB13]|uniref:EexN family lipoprotein n=1 Tax=Rahnella sp. ChDrAdgB13 TaxID=1850581 RepID=UPI001AD87243|nr:EexN family lipoprotein [Rahnella sp. ChDrAdgB13]